MTAATDRAPLLAKRDNERTYGSTPTENSRLLRRSSDLSADLEQGSDGSLTPVNEVSRAGSLKEDEKRPKKFREIWVLCLGLFSASFCSALGATIVANLQIEIGSYFRAGSLASWLGTAYLIGLASMTPLYGRLCGVMGQKRTMLLALWLYIIGTTLCAIAPSMTFVLFARAIGGAGGGGIMSVTAIIISDLVSTADRGLYQGMVNLLFGTGSACGAVIGGAVADRWGWRMAFYIQIPPLLASACLIVWKVNVEHEAGEVSGWTKFKRIDWWGSFVLLISISSLSIGASLTSTSGYPISHPLVSGLFAITLLTLPLFVWIERRAKEPILPLSVLARTQPRIVLIAFTLTTMTNFSRLFMQPVYLHVARGLNGQQTGTLLLPGSLFGSACTLYAGWHMRHFKEYKWFSVFVSSVSWMQALSIMTNWGLDTNTNRLWVEMALGQVGGGTTLTSLLIALISCIEKSEVSLAISAAYLFRAIGQVVGVAIAASIQQSILLSQLAERLSDQPVGLIHRIIQEPSTVLPMLDPLVRIQAKMAYLRSVEGVFGFVSCTGICLSLACLLIRPKPL